MARRPCVGCPWIRDRTAGGIPGFDLRMAEKLAATCPDSYGFGPDFGAPVFACHHSRDGDEFPCAGWLAAVGEAHPGVRLRVQAGGIDPEALSPGEDWPELHETFDEMIAKLRDTAPDASRSVPPPDRPVIGLGIDGVLLHRRDRRDRPVSRSRGWAHRELDDMVVSYLPQTVPWLANVTALAEAVWVTPWSDGAHHSASSILGLERLPELDVSGGRWPALERFAAGRPMIWLDGRETVTAAAGAAAASRHAAGEPTLVVCPDPDRGISPTDMRAVDRFLAQHG